VSDGVTRIAQGDEPEVTLQLDEAVYCREAVLRASNWFTDRLFLKVSQAGPGKIEVRLRARSGKFELGSLIGEFENALLEAQVRIEIAHETAAVRELIVAKAFAEGDLLEDAPAGDWHDPVGASPFRK
jgi:His-Xaa-Ser system protein HxsD